MSSVGALRTSSTEPHTDNMPSSCDGPPKPNQKRHYKIAQIVVTQTTDFRFKVAVFSRQHCEQVQTFSNPDSMWIWITDVSRLHTWEQHEGVGL